MKIKVTQQHIDDGQPFLCGSCPIALAIYELIGHDFEVEVKPRWVNTDYKWKGLLSRYELPPEAIRFISDFDWKRPVSPFEFDLLL